VNRPEHWRPDPGDVRRHAALRRERARAGPLGKLLRYAAIVLVLAGALFAYRNFDTLRNATLDFSALTGAFSRSAASRGDAQAGGSSEPVAIEAPGVVGTSVATSLDKSPIVDTEPDPAPAETTLAAPVLPADTTPPPAAAEAPPAPVVVTEPPPPDEPESFEFGLSTISVSESDASAAVLILRNGGRRGRSTITWWTREGTATAGVDYANLGMVVERFAVGEQNRTIHIPIVGDRNPEGPETFYVLLAAGDVTAGNAQPEHEIEVIINDDD
jgi:hypothetical protein